MKGMELPNKKLILSENRMIREKNMEKKVLAYMIYVRNSHYQKKSLEKSFELLKETAKDIDLFKSISLETIELFSEESGSQYKDAIGRVLETNKNHIYLFFVPSDLVGKKKIDFLHPNHERVHIVPVSEEISNLMEEESEILYTLNKINKSA